jgi:protein-S-isoprenylcysteine O-methyltransferase Ste14
MSLIPEFEIGVWNAWIPMLVFQLITMGLFPLINKEAFKKAGDFPKATTIGQKITIFFEWISIVAILYTVFLPLKLGTLWFYAGMIIYLIGLFIAILALISFTTTPTDDIVTKGIYHYSRHPLYLSWFFTCIGIGLASLSWLFLLYTIAAMIQKFISIGFEEQLCLDKYGDAYRHYMSKTPRWLGFPK